MNIDLTALAVRVRSLISKLNESEDLTALESMKRLLEVATRIKNLQIAAEQSQEDVNAIETLVMRSASAAVLPSPVSTGSTVDQPLLGGSLSRERSTGLKIEINWAVLGKGQAEIIAHRKASESMTAFFARIYSLVGDAGLEKLASLQVNRGPLISKNPRRDFLNPEQNTLYSHKAIEGTNYFVLTHSQTWEKVRDLRLACRTLGLPATLVQITQVQKPSRAEILAQL